MSTPRLLQPSFAGGELKPQLHPRVDIARYQTGAAVIKNAIVMPTGGVTRRPGMKFVAETRNAGAATCPARLIRFVYATGDAMQIEISGGIARAYGKNYTRVGGEQAVPWANTQLGDICFAQSGNVVFAAHPDHPVQMIRRVRGAAGADIQVSALEYRNGPWKTDVLPPEGVFLRIASSDITGGVWSRLVRIEARRGTSTTSYFTPEHVGKLIEMNFATEQRYVTEYKADPITVGGETWYVSESVEIGGQYHIQTHGGWTGRVILERSYDGGTNWVDAVSMYERTDPAAQGNWDISRVEDERNVLYRFRSSANSIKFTLSISSFTKTYIYKIESQGGTYANGRYQRGKDEIDVVPPLVDQDTYDWRVGAWGGGDGYPSVITFYQGRLVLAASKGEPQNIWMSRVNDFADFGTEMEIKDDDAVNITISAPDADGIVGIDALDDLLVRTASGEWRVKGAGDTGAITPTGIVAHRQGTEIGSAPCQSVITGGGAVFVQTHRRSVYAFGYDLSADGFRGNEISIFSDHLFRGRYIVRTAWQQEPDKILWALLSDGTLASCTFDPGQQMNAWARHETNGYVADISVIPQDGFDELWMIVRRNGRWRIERMEERRDDGAFDDCGLTYETCLRTLRLNWNGDGSALSRQKLAARCIVYTYMSDGAFISPAGDRARGRRIEWERTPEMNETDVQLDNGFRHDAGIEIWTEERTPLTVLAISPSMTAGG